MAESPWLLDASVNTNVRCLVLPRRFVHELQVAQQHPAKEDEKEKKAQ